MKWTPIFSRILQILPNPSIKDVLEWVKHYSATCPMPGVRVREKALRNSHSLLHKKVVDRIVQGDIGYLFPMIAPLVPEIAGPLSMKDRWQELSKIAYNRERMPHYIYENKNGEPITLLCSKSGTILHTPEFQKTIQNLLEIDNKGTVIGLISTAWLEALCRASYYKEKKKVDGPNYVREDDLPDELTPESLFGCFLNSLASMPKLLEIYENLQFRPVLCEENAADAVSKEAETLLQTLPEETDTSEGSVVSVEQTAKGKNESENIEVSSVTAPEQPAEQTTPKQRKVAKVAKGTAKAKSVVTSPEETETVPYTDIQEVFDAPKDEMVFEPFPPLEPHLHRSLVYTVLTGGSFWNVYFVAEVKEGGQFVLYDEEVMSHRFPKFGAANIRFPLRSRVPLSDGHFYILEWSDADFVVNLDINGKPREDYEFRTDGTTLVREGRLYAASRTGSLLVVVCDRDGDSIEWEKPLYVHVLASKQASAQDRYLKGSSVLVHVDDRLYGPVTVREDAQHRPFVNFGSDLTRSNGLLGGYLVPSVPLAKKHCLSFEKFDAETFGRIPVSLILLPGLPRKLFDMAAITEILLKLSSATATTEEKRKNFADLIEAAKDSEFLFSTNPKVRSSRERRLMRLLIAVQTSDQIVDGAALLISMFFNRLAESKKSAPFMKKLAEQLLGMPSFLDQFEGYKLVADRLKALRDEEKKFSANLEARTSEGESKLSALDKEIEEKKREKTALEEQMIRGIESQVKELEKRKAKLEHEISLAGEHLKEAYANPGRYAFDGAIAAKFMEAAAEWESNSEKASFDARARCVSALPLCDKKNDDLKHYLLDSVKAYRPYPSNAVLNLFVLLTQNFLTILSGPPGAGKTSMCVILAHTLGLTTIHAQEAVRTNGALWDDPRNADRYLPVSVERGWTSKRDFIGYYNPLTHTFESLDARRYEAFAELNAEKNIKCEKIPYLMLLDEANLSPMEYYFADFMNICDERNDLSFISLGDKMRYGIPDTLRFVATINDDFTTENLSPRLLDRAAIATLPEVDVRRFSDFKTKKLDLDEVRPIVSWDAMKTLFGHRDLGTNRVKVEGLLDELCTIFALLSGHYSPVSPRTRISCLRYVSAALNAFERTDRPTHLEAMDYAVAQRLLPRINGNGPRYRERLDELASYLRSHDLNLSLRLLENILSRGELEMDFYRFCG